MDSKTINTRQYYQLYNRKKYQPEVKLNNNGGVVIIEKSCNNNQGRSESAIILFKCVTWYTDGGGRQSPSKCFGIWRMGETLGRDCQFKNGFKVIFHYLTFFYGKETINGKGIDCI